MNLKDFIDTMTRAKRGVKPAYTRYHVLKCLLLIHHDEPIGRIKLSKALRLGETTVRTLLNRLKEEQIINVDKIGGVYLVGKGKILLRTIFSILEDIQNIGEVLSTKIMTPNKYLIYTENDFLLNSSNRQLFKIKLKSDSVHIKGIGLKLVSIISNKKYKKDIDITNGIKVNSANDLILFFNDLNKYQRILKLKKYLI